MLNHNQGNRHFMITGSYDIYTKTEGGFKLKVLHCYPGRCLIDRYDFTFPFDITEEEFIDTLHECKMYTEELTDVSLLSHISYPISIIEDDNFMSIKTELEHYSCIVIRES